MSAANRLEVLAKRVMIQRRARHMIALADLREFMQTQPVDVLCLMIADFNDVGALRAVQEAGAKGRCYEVLVDRIRKELEKK